MREWLRHPHLNRSSFLFVMTLAVMGAIALTVVAPRHEFASLAPTALLWKAGAACWSHFVTDAAIRRSRHIGIPPSGWAVPLIGLGGGVLFEFDPSRLLVGGLVGATAIVLLLLCAHPGSPKTDRAQSLVF